MLEIRRTLTSALRAHLNKPEITLLIGPRQAGKTTILKELSRQLTQNGERTLFLNLDIERDRRHFTSQETLVQWLEAVTGGKPYYIFIDEIQRLTNAGLFLKGLFDRMLPHKLIVTGSGSLELKEKMAESLVGRKRNFYLYTVSPGEFAHYRTDYQFADRLPDVLFHDPTVAETLLSEYLRFGGYPAVVTDDTESEKLATLDEIYQGYIERDIQALLQLDKTAAFVMLLRLVANRSGQTINYSDLAKHTGLSTPTLKNYLWYAEKTFITQSVSPYFTNKEKEIVKSPMYYLLDTGLRNFLRGIYDDIADNGPRFQTMVYRLLEERFRSGVSRLHFWQTKGRAEVDFVVDRGFDLLPVEVKFTALKQPKITRSYHSFLQQYTPAEGWIVNRSLRADITVGQTQVRFIPWYDLLTT
jgi:predicted AAA+ superfamily ATPase